MCAHAKLSELSDLKYYLFSRNRPVFIHTRATCSESPSNVSSMAKLHSLGHETRAKTQEEKKQS